MITIHTADNQTFQVPNTVAQLIQFIHACIEDEEDDEVFLPKVNGRELAKILEFCSMYVTEPMHAILHPLRTNDLKTLVGDRYSTFVQSIDVTHELVELMIAVDFLGQESFMSLLCAHMAILANTSDNVDAFIAKFDAKYLTA
jgi:hypothetical protein